MQEALLAVGIVAGVAALGVLLSWFLSKRERRDAVEYHGSAALLEELRRQGSEPRSGEGARELDEDRQVGVEPDPVDPPDVERA